METRTQRPDIVLSGSLLVVLGAIGFSAKPVLIKLAYTDSAPVDAITFPLADSPDIALGALLVLTSGIVFALYLTGSGHFIPRFGSRRFTAYSMSIASVATLAHFLVFHPVAQLFVSADIFGLALALAIFSTVLPAFLINAGIRRIGADHSSIITSIGPIVTLALAYLVLDESLGPAQIAGAALVLLGVVLVGLVGRDRRSVPGEAGA
jgi:drug/metabolite transporter (DMT)-like permease